MALFEIWSRRIKQMATNRAFRAMTKDLVIGDFERLPTGRELLDEVARHRITEEEERASVARISATQVESVSAPASAVATEPEERAVSRARRLDLVRGLTVGGVAAGIFALGVGSTALYYASGQQAQKPTAPAVELAAPGVSGITAEQEQVAVDTTRTFLKEFYRPDAGVPTALGYYDASGLLPPEVAATIGSDSQEDRAERDRLVMDRLAEIRATAPAGTLQALDSIPIEVERVTVGRGLGTTGVPLGDINEVVVSVGSGMTLTFLPYDAPGGGPQNLSTMLLARGADQIPDRWGEALAAERSYSQPSTPAKPTSISYPGRPTGPTYTISSHAARGASSPPR